MRKGFSVYLLIVFILFTLTLKAQTNTFNKDSSSSGVTISGDLGAYGELYSISGQKRRRPSSTGRIFFRPVINLFGLFQIPFEFLISTEGSSARQNINQFGLNPKWGWGSAHLGDFNEDYSQLTLSGIKIRGGGLNLSPGNFRFSVAAGFTQRSVPGGAQDGSFKRFLIAAKLGIGKKNNSFFDLIFLKAKDDINSLQQGKSSITLLNPNGNDVLVIGNLYTIRWSSSNLSGNLKIELSRDNGITFETIEKNAPNIGFYTWSVNGPTTFQALIRITSNVDSTINDISDFNFTIGAGVEAKTGNYSKNKLINPNAVTPQENLVLGTKGRIKFYKNKFTLSFEGGASAYTRDLRAKALNLDSISVPSIATKIFLPRASSNFDYAIISHLNLNFTSFNAKIGYKRIGPGYNSLGLGYLQNDQNELSILTGFRVQKFAVSLSYLNQKDNLLDQKLFTTSRNIYTASINGAVTKYWTLGIFANILDMKNNSDNDTNKIDFGNTIIGTSQNFILGQSSLLRTISLNYTYQVSQNNSMLIKNSNNSIHNVNIGMNFFLSTKINATLNAGIIHSEMFDTLSTNTQNYAFAFNYRAPKKHFSAGLNLSASFIEANTSIRTSVHGEYNITKSDGVVLTISYLKADRTTNLGGGFDELISSLSYTHHF